MRVPSRVLTAVAEEAKKYPVFDHPLFRCDEFAKMMTTMRELRIVSLVFGNCLSCYFRRFFNTLSIRRHAKARSCSRQSSEGRGAGGAGFRPR